MTDPAVTPDESFFLSYSRKDEAFALRLAEAVRKQGIRIWVDQLDIRPSEHWDRAIERAVRHSHGIVVLLSPRSVASDNVADEISFAIDNGKSVLPVMIETCSLPLRIARMQVIDATANFSKAVRECVAELRRTQAGVSSRETSSSADGALDSGALAEVKRQLGSFVGPIATVLVDKAARKTSSVRDLYRLVSAHIDGDAERERFLAMTPTRVDRPRKAEGEPQSRSVQIAAADLEAISLMLARYVGPIASVLTRREATSSESIEDLTRRLAASIPDDDERSHFLREALPR
jgi:hypothetical protein